MDEHLAAHVAELFRAFNDTSRVRIFSVYDLISELRLSSNNG